MMKKVLFSISWLLMLWLCCLSCSRKNTQSNYSLNVNSIVFPTDMHLYDYDYDNFKGLDSKCKLVISFDSLVCGTCSINRLIAYKDIVEYIESYKTKASVIFIFSPKIEQKEEMISMISFNPIDYPIYLDVNNSFSSLNKIPKGFFACLLDSNNNIVFHGDPFEKNNKSHYFDSIKVLSL